MSRVKIVVAGDWRGDIETEIEGTNEEIASEIVSILTVGAPQPLDGTKKRVRFYPSHRINYVDVIMLEA